MHTVYQAHDISVQTDQCYIRKPQTCVFALPFCFVLPDLFPSFSTSSNTFDPLYCWTLVISSRFNESPKPFLLLSYGTSEMDVKAGERTKVIKRQQMSSFTYCTHVISSICTCYVLFSICVQFFSAPLWNLFFSFCLPAGLFLWLFWLHLYSLFLLPLCCPVSQPESKQLSPLLDSARGM